MSESDWSFELGCLTHLALTGKSTMSDTCFKKQIVLSQQCCVAHVCTADSAGFCRGARMGGWLVISHPHTVRLQCTVDSTLLRVASLTAHPMCNIV